MVLEALLGELLHWYIDNLVLLATNTEGVAEENKKWKDKMESKDLRVNVEKTKVMTSGEDSGPGARSGKLALCNLQEMDRL